MNSKTEKPRSFGPKTEKPIEEIAKTAKPKIPMPPSSMPRLANWNHLRLSARTKLRREFRLRKVQNILRANFFMFILLISNHTVFLVQFGINLHLWVIQRAEIALTEAARAISAFWITHSSKLIPNWTRNRMLTYTNNHNVHKTKKWKTFV